MSPVPGHPYVWAGVQEAPGGILVTMRCTACGDQYQHHCTYPPKADAWIARYGAQHHHNAPGVREAFFRQYDATLHRLRRSR